jgi:hypothetical protein
MALGKGNESTAPGDGREQSISTKVLDAGVNGEQAWAHIVGWFGPEDHPRQWVDDRISIVFQSEVHYLRAEAAQAGCPYEIIWDPEITPLLRLLDPRDEEDVLAKLAELKQVAPEAVMEKATSPVVSKLLGIEWRDPEEIALERATIERTD